MRTVAYLMVSTAQQDVRSQRLAILEYARQYDYGLPSRRRRAGADRAHSTRSLSSTKPDATPH